jgi:hypothetical protein
MGDLSGAGLANAITASLSGHEIRTISTHCGIRCREWGVITDAGGSDRTLGEAASSRERTDGHDANYLVLILQNEERMDVNKSKAP